MDINLVRSLITLALFVLFIILIYQVYRKKNKRHYEEAAHLLFTDGDERSNKLKQEQPKVDNHD
ncbi:cbb3-type cytochrome oxidase subunit 3 [Aliikangiella sp. IMCC44359]|uniref:cbb3-type cytochrome oxidase subunit 3 n=1 Tax=Aliikangiella sp. IMCC44359 TaxID=3459125 RepID=UPI00403AE79E